MSKRFDIIKFNATTRKVLEVVSSNIAKQGRFNTVNTCLDRATTTLGANESLLVVDTGAYRVGDKLPKT